jgi:formate dehydrogenase maturation protein FdhE
MRLHCTVCTSEIQEKRIRRGAQTCGTLCEKKKAHMVAEDQRARLRGNTCPTCLRYVPLSSTEMALIESLRLIGALGHGNAARFA